MGLAPPYPTPELETAHRIRWRTPTRQPTPKQTGLQPPWRCGDDVLVEPKQQVRRLGLGRVEGDKIGLGVWGDMQCRRTANGRVFGCGEPCAGTSQQSRTQVVARVQLPPVPCQHNRRSVLRTLRLGLPRLPSHRTNRCPISRPGHTTYGSSKRTACMAPSRAHPPNSGGWAKPIHRRY